jgi:putative transposase
VTNKMKVKNEAMAAKTAALPTIPKELIDQFVSGPTSAQAVKAASMAFKKAPIERALGAELSSHLGYAAGADEPHEANNHRKWGQRQDRPDRGRSTAHQGAARPNEQHEPLLIPKHERRFTGFDDKIVAMSARGMTVREIQGFLAE